MGRRRPTLPTTATRLLPMATLCRFVCACACFAGHVRYVRARLTSDSTHSPRAVSFSGPLRARAAIRGGLANILTIARPKNVAI